MPRKKKLPKDTRSQVQSVDDEEAILIHVRLRKETYKKFLDEGFNQRPMKKVHTIAGEILEAAAQGRKRE